MSRLDPGYYFLIEGDSLMHPIASSAAFPLPEIAYKSAKRILIGAGPSLGEEFNISVYRVSESSKAEVLVLGPKKFRPKDPESRLESIAEAFGGSWSYID
jgi:hypothetical protein